MRMSSRHNTDRSPQAQAQPQPVQQAGSHQQSTAWRSILLGRLSRYLHDFSRQEWLWVALIAFCYVFFFMPATTNSISRYDMVAALARGTAIIDPYASNTIDVSYYRGHYYSPRSLGLSLLAVPFLGLAQALAPLLPPQPNVLTPTVGFLTLFTVVPVALAGSVVFLHFARRLRPDLVGTPFPLVVATAFALGTLYYPFAVSFFSHTFAAALDVIAFYLLYQARAAVHPTRRVAAAGLLVGFAVISEYPTAVTMLVLGVYVWAVFPRERRRMLAIFGAAMLPSALLLGWYNWFAFGNPLHISYEFVAGDQFAGQHRGFFGLTFPSLAGLGQILLWPRGLLVNAPVLAFVPLGFFRWLRSTSRPSAEALVCLAISVLYPLLISSYFLPMAGENLPGPRLLVPMLPFTCLPLLWAADDVRRWPRVIFAPLLAVSVLLSFLWVALGVREYHAYPTYPIAELFWPILTTGRVPSGNFGDTPPNLAALMLQIPQNFSIYVCLVPVLAWLVFMTCRLVAYDVPHRRTGDRPPGTDTRRT